MQHWYVLVLCLALSACKQANSGDGTEEGTRIGASDASARRDTDFKKRTCYCSFLLDDNEREPFSERDSATTKKSDVCKFVTASDGRDKHQLESLTIESFSGAQTPQYESQFAKLLQDFSEHFSRYDQTLKKGSRDDLRIELRIGKTNDGRYEKRTVAYDDYVGRMFFVRERSLNTGEKHDMADVFGNTDIRYIDELFLNYQGACETSLDL